MWTIGNVRTQEKGKDIFWLERAGSFKERVRRTYITAYAGSLTNDRGLLGFETFYPTDPRNTDRPTHESLRKNCPIFGKAYMYKVEL